MSTPERDTYIPYVATAMSIVESDQFITYMCRLGIPSETADKLFEKVVGQVHDGIETGLSLSTQEPISAIEAYRLGVREGIEEADNGKGE